MSAKMAGSIVSIQVGRPVRLQTSSLAGSDPKEWVSGIHKQSTPGPVYLGRLNLEGDGQADLLHHGGPDRAALLYTASRYPVWRVDLGLPGLPFGAFGENLTVDGLSEASVCLGDVYRAGDVEIQVSQPRIPCWKLAWRNEIPDLAAQVLSRGWTGWYVRVLREGLLEPGLELQLVERPCPEWTVEEAHRVHAERLQNPDAAQRLAACAYLSELWQDFLNLRV